MHSAQHPASQGSGSPHSAPRSAGVGASSERHTPSRGGTAQLISVAVEGVECHTGLPADGLAAGRSPRSTMLPADAQGSSDDDEMDAEGVCSGDDGYDILSADDLPPKPHSSWV